MPDILKYQRSDLEHRLEPGQLALLQMVADVAATRQLPLYLVGGFVRDVLLGIPAADLDLVVEGDAIALARALASRYGGRVTAHLRFGTAQWFRPGPGHRTLDFISTRSETYKHPAALPTVKRSGLSDDLARRDFTINTLALRLDGKHWGELRDDLGGLEDLERGLVRVLHPGSFSDDPTRLFRSVRYEQRYGFRIVPETLALIPQARHLINSLSPERLRHELDLILAEEKVVAMLSRLNELGLLQTVHSALKWNSANSRRFGNGLRQDLEPPIKGIPASLERDFLGWHFWLMDIPSKDLESLEQRLHFRSKLSASLSAASTLYSDLTTMAGLKPSQCVARLESLPLLAVYSVYLANPEDKGSSNLRKYLETWRRLKPKTNGQALIERGLPPGPLYKQVLLRLREAWLDGEVKTEKEELNLLEELTNPAAR
jgi:tRNA nucleotidyltransferase (CCA-adding enzyme)